MEKALLMAVWGFTAGAAFAALFGVALDGALQDTFFALRDCARSLR